MREKGLGANAVQGHLLSKLVRSSSLLLVVIMSHVSIMRFERNSASSSESSGIIVSREGFGTHLPLSRHVALMRALGDAASFSPSFVLLILAVCVDFGTHCGFCGLKVVPCEVWLFLFAVATGRDVCMYVFVTCVALFVGAFGLFSFVVGAWACCGVVLRGTHKRVAPS